ncbi:hypothetical protein ZIOFF_024469 [Zingiber officinale]|uniref:Uncharacterized protein n=1 Tax=Zingiber officinale TaxID=94328 RepID=A0A8J5LD91_ZINOF|nr:hypothetical protein ZIOFF_024469 [Zingiber officinale]
MRRRRRGQRPDAISLLDGASYVKEIIEGNPAHCQEMLRMKKEAFIKICSIFRENEWLKDSRYISVEEKMSMFLITLSHNLRVRFVKRRFCHSTQTINFYFHEVLKAMLKFSKEIIVPTQGNQISHDTRHKRLREVFKFTVPPFWYPDDPYDRIWESDSLKRANYLVDVATRTKRISTTVPIDVNSDERPPSKVMQTAVVGQNGGLNYRLNLNGVPGNGWAFCYFAEIEDLKPDEIRKFRLVLPGNKELTHLIVNVEENAQRKYRLYEPGSYNISLPFVLSFAFKKTNDSSKGPILNAFEIYKYMEINYGSLDVYPLYLFSLLTMESFVSHYPKEVWAQEGGDPCLPAPWSWVQCNSDPQPQIVSMY